MDTINLRLKQLDDIETGLYLERERAIQRRRREDLELQSKRQQEDQDFLQQLSSRDDEEDPNYRHKMKGTFSSNRHAIEVCGEVAPGQEGILSRAQAQAIGNAPTGNMASSTTLAASNSLSNTYNHEGRPSSGFLSDSLVGSDNGLGSSPVGSTVRDLGKVYRASFVTRNSRSHVEKTRSDQAEELYNGLSSSDPEEGDEAQLKSSIPADKIDGHVAAKDNASQYKFPLGAEESDSICATEEHQATANATTDATNITVKVEGATTPPFFVYQSPEYPSPISLAATDRAFRVPYPGTKTNTKMQKGDISATQNQKRAASSPPSTPPPLGKRPLGTDEPSTI